MNRPIQNPLGMSQDPTRTIYYTKSGAWWEDRDAHTLQGVAQGSFEVDMDAAAAECCCEIKELISAEACTTRELINRIDSDNAKADLLAAKAELLAAKYAKKGD